MNTMRDRLLFFILTGIILLSCAKQRKQDDVDLQVTDISIFSVQEENINQSQYSYSEEELMVIMKELEVCLGKADKDIMRNFKSAAPNVSEKRIDVYLIITDKKMSKDFRERVMDSPALFFVKTDYGVVPSGGVSEVDGISLYTGQYTYSSSTQTIDVYLNNQTETRITYGERYLLAYEEDSVWKVLPMNDNFEDVAHILKPNTQTFFTVDLLPDLRKNNPGKYRVYLEVRKDVEHTLMAEFRLLKEQKISGPPLRSDNSLILPSEFSINYDSEGNRVYTVVELMPEYPGGQSWLVHYIAEQTKHIKVEEKCRTTISFIIDKKGRVQHPIIVRSCGNDILDGKAIRIVRSLQRFQPGKQNGEIVAVRYTLSVPFETLEEKE